MINFIHIKYRPKILENFTILSDIKNNEKDIKATENIGTNNFKLDLNIFIFFSFIFAVLIAMSVKTIYANKRSEITAKPTCCSTNLEKRIASNEII